MIRVCDKRAADEAVETIRTRKQLLHMGALANLIEDFNERVTEAAASGDVEDVAIYATGTAAAMKCIPQVVILGETRKFYLCPACFYMFDMDCDPEPYCCHCGQALDWSPANKGGAAPTTVDLLAVEIKDD